MSEEGVVYGAGGSGRGRRRFRLANLPPPVLACIGVAVRRALGLPPRGACAAAAGADPAPGVSLRRAGPRGRRQPNKTEARYRAERLALLDARYEALTFHLGNGHRYTPDWVVFRADGGVECHEVKGAYRLGSLGRARLAFDQVRTEFPQFRWVWAAWTGSAWEEES